LNGLDDGLDGRNGLDGRDAGLNFDAGLNLDGDGGIRIEATAKTSYQPARRL
jgi:hypothetical protein